MRAQHPAVDRSRAWWLALADRLLAGAQAWSSPNGALITPPGAEGGYGRQVTVQRLVQKVLLLGAEALGLCSEIQPLEDGVLKRELVDDGLLERSLGACSPQGIAQLMGIERVGVVGNHEW